MRPSLQKFDKEFWTYGFVSLLAPISPKLEPFTKYLRLTLVSCEIAHYGKSLISVFQQVLASIEKKFYLGRKTGY